MDLSQETFVKVWKSLKFFKFESAFSTWIYRVAGNVCLDFLRRQKRTQSLTVSDEEVQLDLPDESRIQPTCSCKKTVRSRSSRR